MHVGAEDLQQKLLLLNEAVMSEAKVQVAVRARPLSQRYFARDPGLAATYKYTYVPASLHGFSQVSIFVGFYVPLHCPSIVYPFAVAQS